MDEIELVVKIPKEEYEMIVNSEDCGLHTLTRVIAHGIPLPKGHRLMDADEFINSLKGIERLHIDDELRSSILDAVNTNILVEADKESEEQV